jgi:hypothetical protein
MMRAILWCGMVMLGAFVLPSCVLHGQEPELTPHEQEVLEKAREFQRVASELHGHVRASRVRRRHRRRLTHRRGC